jgi:hypothetical protein
MHEFRLLAAIALTAGLMASASARILDESKFPDLKGQWDRVGVPNWTPAGTPPFTPEYQAVFEANRADMKNGGAGGVPSQYCYPQGMPMMMNFYDPMEIVVTLDVTYILISHVNDSYRRIYTDGRGWPAEDEFVPTYAGYSIGKWIDEDGDGKLDVLEVETRHLLNPRVYDASGLPFHSDGKTIVKERIYLDKADPNVLHDDITVYDDALVRPRVSNKRYIRELRPLVWVEAICPEGNPYVQIEGEIYMRDADGKIMPAKKGQRPPDLRHFSEGANK